MTRSASTRRRMFRSNTIVPAPHQDRPPVAMTLVLVGFAVAFGVWWWL